MALDWKFGLTKTNEHSFCKEHSALEQEGILIIQNKTSKTINKMDISVNKIFLPKIY